MFPLKALDRMARGGRCKHKLYDLTHVANPSAYMHYGTLKLSIPDSLLRGLKALSLSRGLKAYVWLFTHPADKLGRSRSPHLLVYYTMYICINCNAKMLHITKYGST